MNQPELNKAMREVEKIEEAEQPLGAVEKATHAINAFTDEIRSAAANDAHSANLDAMEDLMADHRMSIDLEEEAIRVEFEAITERVKHLKGRQEKLAKAKQAAHAYEYEMSRP